MKTYLVEVTAVVWKQIEVRAESVEAADTMAHELFNLAADGQREFAKHYIDCPERYDQQTSQIWLDGKEMM
jgi:hypothetical protein